MLSSSPEAISPQQTLFEGFITLALRGEIYTGGKARVSRVQERWYRFKVQGLEVGSIHYQNATVTYMPAHMPSRDKKVGDEVVVELQNGSQQECCFFFYADLQQGLEIGVSYADHAEAAVHTERAELDHNEKAISLLIGLCAVASAEVSPWAELSDTRQPEAVAKIAQRIWRDHTQARPANPADIEYGRQVLMALEAYDTLQ